MYYCSSAMFICSRRKPTPGARYCFRLRIRPYGVDSRGPMKGNSDFRHLRRMRTAPQSGLPHDAPCSRCRILWCVRLSRELLTSFLTGPLRLYARSHRPPRRTHASRLVPAAQQSKFHSRAHEPREAKHASRRRATRSPACL